MMAAPRRSVGLREETECEERQAQSDRPPQREVVIVTEVANRVEQANAQVDNLDRQREHPYDSAKGRQSRAERYAQSGNHRAAEARILADEANALHPTYATRARLSRRRRISRGPCQPRPRYASSATSDDRIRARTPVQGAWDELTGVVGHQCCFARAVRVSHRLGYSSHRRAPRRIDRKVHHGLRPAPCVRP
jgi:hypothetical protein